MKQLACISLFFLLWSCNQDKVKTETIPQSQKKEAQLEFIQINYAHCFLYPSSIQYNVSNNSILFQHCGTSMLLAEPPNMEDDYNELVEMFRPVSTFFHLEENESSYLKDSILLKFTEIDYQDTSISDMFDGGGKIILFAYDNDSCKTAESWNAQTENQFLLSDKLIELCMKHAKDSLTIEYLETLRRYYD